MVIKDAKKVVRQEEKPPGQGADGAQGEAGTSSVPYPDLGRSVRVVGNWRSVDASETPHEKNRRGELGKPMYNWYINRTSKDPLGRVAANLGAADRRNTLPYWIGRGRRGSVNPEKVEAPDAEAMTRHIKRVASFLGADVVGITRLHPSFLYTGSRYPDTGDGSRMGAAANNQSTLERARQMPFVISMAKAWDYDMGRAHRHRIGDAAYHFSQQKLQVIYANLAAYIRELGYSAIQSVAQSMPVGLAAGIGEMGRHGMLISEKFGSRIHLGDPILTDLPLLPDKPLDIGVEDFCKVCRKCATTCPTNSITMEGKSVVNGIEKYKINWRTCYGLRPYVTAFWEICLTCVTVCPYTKPKSWWHTLAVESLKNTPVLLRPLVVRPLKLLDDVFWGKVPRKRVKWLEQDSGVLPVTKARNGAGGVPPEKEAPGSAESNGNIGYYYPLKENTRRFEILRERKARAK